MTEWQPIETAPKDGTEVLTCRLGNLMAVSVYLPRRNKWCIVDGPILDGPTHWMPLPPPPARGALRHD